MLKQKIDTAALFAQKKTEVQSSARTLLILDGQENAYISADELTEELLAIPEEGAIWLDMSLFGSHDQVMTVARSFKLSPATQNILENKKQQPRLFRDGNNRILVCRHLQLNESGNAVYNNICFAASANRLVVPMPKGAKASDAELLAMNTSWAACFQALNKFYSAPNKEAAESTIGALREHMAQVYYHQANVEHFATPELDFES